MKTRNRSEQSLKIVDCKICLEKMPLDKLGIHTRRHKMTSQQYYEVFIDKRKLCLVCNKETNYKNIVFGFNDFCSKSCRMKYQIINHPTFLSIAIKSRSSHKRTENEKNSARKTLAKLKQDPEF